MGRHARKKLKIEKSAIPLGSQVSLTDDIGKDDEERRLESLLFGVPLAQSAGGQKSILLSVPDGEEEITVEGGTELENMLDTDVSLIGKPFVSMHYDNAKSFSI